MVYVGVTYGMTENKVETTIVYVWAIWGNIGSCSCFDSKLL